MGEPAWDLLGGYEGVGSVTTYVPPTLAEYLRRAATALDCCVQLAGPPLSVEFDAMERRLDEILTSRPEGEGDG